MPSREFAEIYRRWLGLKSKHPLRNRLPACPPVETLPESGPIEPPKKMSWPRAEYVEAMAKPPAVKFFDFLKCDCENCGGIAGHGRVWELHNGLKCQMLINRLPPPQRPRRDVVAKPLDYLPAPLELLPPQLLASREPPRGSLDWTAEVVVIVSSLSSVRRPFHASQRLLAFLDCKGVDVWAIDVNDDAGLDRPDRGLLARWRHLHYVCRDPTRKGKRDVLVPQMLVDGVVVGGFPEVLMLEEENDLDYVLAGAACPNCLVARQLFVDNRGFSLPELNEDGTRVESADEYNCRKSRPSLNFPDFCYNCGAVFRKMVNSEIVPKPAMKPLVTHCFRSSCRPRGVGIKFTQDFIRKSPQVTPPQKKKLFIF